MKNLSTFTGLILAEDIDRHLWPTQAEPVFSSYPNMSIIYNSSLKYIIPSTNKFELKEITAQLNFKHSFFEFEKVIQLDMVNAYLCCGKIKFSFDKTQRNKEISFLAKQIYARDETFLKYDQTFFLTTQNIDLFAKTQVSFTLLM
jgi:hypothetical protein